MAARSLPAQDISGKKHPSATTSSGLIFLSAFLRNQFSVTSWLLMGAVFQAAIFMLPLRPVYAFGPAMILMALQLVDNMLMILGIKRNIYMDGVYEGKYAAAYPGPDGSFSGEDGHPMGGQLCFFTLSVKSNHPLGMLAPGFGDVSGYFQKMLADLERHAEEYGFFGSKSWLNADDRYTNSELMTTFYFRSSEHVHKFAHAKAHRDGWDWFTKHAKTHKHIAIGHELYDAPPGRWENIYANSHVSGFGSSSLPFKGEDGNKLWMKPVVDASRGKLRSTKGRMGRDEGVLDEKLYGDFYN